MTPAAAVATTLAPRHRGLRDAALAALRRLVPAGTPCALIDFPTSANVGDSAIWLGARSLLDEAGASVVYACDRHSFSADHLDAALAPGGTILISGGGNLGDLWPAHQRFRELVVATFHHRRIVQLPQSVMFREPSNAARAAAVFDAHPDLTLMTRDRSSFERATATFAAPTVLSPDMAFGMETLPSAGPPPELDVLWLRREDHEGRPEAEPADGAGIVRTDWAGGQGGDGAWLAEERRLADLRRSIADDLTGVPLGGGGTTQTVVHSSTRAAIGACDALAWLQLARGCRLLGRSRVVVTDRLHGHVLCALLGIPHVVLDDRFGKIRSLWETWTADWPSAAWARSAADALGSARFLLARTAGRRP